MVISALEDAHSLVGSGYGDGSGHGYGGGYGYGDGYGRGW